VDKPSLPGNYKVRYEGPNESNMTPGTQFMGVPYSGVTVSNGTVAFTSDANLVTLHTRLADAYEDHSNAFFLANSSLTDDQLDVLITSTGFDENLPLREFEGYFGISSYRASIEAGEMAYMNQTLSYDPDTGAVTADDILRTFMNTSAEVTIGENTIAASRNGPFNELCFTFLRASEKHPYASGKEVKIVG